MGAGDFEGATYFWQVADGGHFFLAAPIFKKPAKPIFLRVSGKNKTKKKFDKNFLGGGATYFWRAQKSKSPQPLPTARK